MSFILETINPEIEQLLLEENESNQGWAFQLWVARLLAEYNQDIDGDEIRDNLLSSQDGGIDIILNDKNNQHSYVIQTKRISHRKAVKGEDIDGFFAKYNKYTHEPSILDRMRLAHNARDTISEYVNRTNEGWSSTWIFATTGRIPSSHQAGDHKLKDDEIDCKIWNPTELEKIYKQAKSRYKSIPTEITFDIPKDKYLVLKEPRKTLIAVVKGNKIRALYDKYQDSLLAYNIRFFLGGVRKNINIIETARADKDDIKKGGNFFYYNNGISAICNNFEIINNNKIRAEKFQIINGGQTVGSLFKAGNNDNVQVLLRLTEGEGEATEKGFNADIIRYNNTQNIIKMSDFRSNDAIQKDICKKFQQFNKKIIDKKIDYRPKRGGKNVTTGYKKLELEDLAKIRFGYLYSPYICSESQNLLLNVEAHYKKAFGEPDGHWSANEFQQVILILWFYAKIENKIKELKSKAKEKKEDPSEYNYLKRLRYHILGLAKIYVEHKKFDNTIWKNEKKFNELFDEFWKLQIQQTVHIKREGEKSTATRGGIANIVRSKERWKELSADFLNLLNSQ